MSSMKWRPSCMIVGLIICLMAGLSGRAMAAPGGAPIPFTVGPGAVGSINGHMGSIVSIPTGAALTPSPRGILLPVGTVVNISGQRETLTQRTPFVLTTGGIRPPTLPDTGSSVNTFVIALGLISLALLLTGRVVRRSTRNIFS